MQSNNLHSASSDDSGLTEFLTSLETIPWFANIGKPLPSNSNCRQIGSWEEWAGPEDLSVADMDKRHSSLREELMGAGESTRLSQLWSRIQDIVFQHAARRVPYDENKDTWHPPNGAVWQAIWTAGLVGLCHYLRRPVPRDIEVQWRWFRCGHWPCDWEGDIADGYSIVY